METDTTQPMVAAPEPLDMECGDCHHTFEVDFRSLTQHVKCPGCGSFNTGIEGIEAK